MERRVIGKNEIKRTIRNWKNWRETVRNHGRDIARTGRRLKSRDSEKKIYS